MDLAENDLSSLVQDCSNNCMEYLRQLIEKNYTEAKSAVDVIESLIQALASDYKKLYNDKKNLEFHYNQLVLYVHSLNNEQTTEPIADSSQCKTGQSKPRVFSPVTPTPRAPPSSSKAKTRPVAKLPVRRKVSNKSQAKKKVVSGQVKPKIEPESSFYSTDVFSKPDASLLHPPIQPSSSSQANLKQTSMLDYMH